MDHSHLQNPGTRSASVSSEAAYTVSILEYLKALGIPETYGIDRGLPLQQEAAVLEVVRVVAEGRRLELVPETAVAWRAMVSAAESEGIILLLISGFRSVQRQREILQRKLAAGETIGSILRVNAAPGYSEHHTGRAVDIGTPGCPPLEERFEETEAFGWLWRNAGGFGFFLSYPRDNPHGIIYEPWHWLHRSRP